jgi:histidine triad (HIT) family protein
LGDGDFKMSCLFCKMAAGEIPVDFVFETDSVFAIKDISPQAPTHILILPKSHHDAAAQIAEDLGLDGFRSVFNTGASAGQSVFHAHLHLLGGRPFAWPPG